MAQVIPFPVRPLAAVDDIEIDIFTAVDAAIRDLRDIAERCDASARRQAEECRQMLERAFAMAMSQG
jgi:hypothetical protein